MSRAAEADSLDQLVETAEVVVHHVTNRPARPGHAALHSERAWVAVPEGGRGRGSSEAVVFAAPAAGASGDSAGAKVLTSDEYRLRALDRLAAPVLRVPAPIAASACFATTDVRRTTRSAGAGVDLEVVSENNAPASTITVRRDGRVVATVQQEWVRRRQSWDLIRQTMATPEDGVVDVTTVERRHGSRPLAARGIPQVLCGASSFTGDRSGPGVTSASPFGAGTFGPFAGARTPSSGPSHSGGTVDGECSVEGSPDPCAVKRRARDQAIAEYAAQALATYAVCFLAPPPVDVACLPAIGLLLPKGVAIRNAVEDVRECEQAARDAQRQKCGCNVTSKADTASGVVFSRSAVAPAPGARRADAMSICDVSPGDTEYPPAPPTISLYLGEGGSDSPESLTFSGGGFVTMRICSYTDYYSADGTFLFTVSNGCVDQMI